MNFFEFGLFLRIRHNRFYLICSGTPLVPEQVLHFFGLKLCKNAFLKGIGSETEVPNNSIQNTHPESNALPRLSS